MKKILLWFWNEFVYGGHLLALGSGVIIYDSMKLLEMQINWELIIATYLISFVVYSFDRFFHSRTESSRFKESFMGLHPKIFAILIIICASLVLFILLSGGLIVGLYGIFLLAIGIAYSLFFKKFTSNVLGFKSYFVAIAYGSVIFLIPLFFRISTNWIIVILFIFFIMRWFINTTFCDLKDKEEDAKKNLKTFAVNLSKLNFYFLLNLINILSIVPIIVGLWLGLLPLYSLLLLLVLPYSFFYIKKSQNQKIDLQILCNFWADAESLVWLGSVMIGSKIWVF